MRMEGGNEKKIHSDKWSTKFNKFLTIYGFGVRALNPDQAKNILSMYFTLINKYLIVKLLKQPYKLYYAAKPISDSLFHIFLTQFGHFWNNWKPLKRSKVSSDKSWNLDSNFCLMDDFRRSLAWTLKAVSKRMRKLIHNLIDLH